MATIFFDRVITSPLGALRAPAHPVGPRARAWQFAKSEVAARVVALFASVVALIEFYTQMLLGSNVAFLFMGEILAGSVIGLWNPDRLLLLALRLQVEARQIARSAGRQNAFVEPEIHRLRKEREISVQQLETYLQAQGALVNALDQNGRTALYRECQADNPRADVIKTLLDHGATFAMGVELNADTLDLIWREAFQQGRVFKALLQHPRTYAVTFAYLCRDIPNADRVTLGMLLDDYNDRLHPWEVEVGHLFNEAVAVGGGVHGPSRIIAQYAGEGLNHAQYAEVQQRLNALRVAEGMPPK